MSASRRGRGPGGPITGSAGTTISSAQSGVDDLVLLSPLSEQAIERNLRVRFDKDIIYTNIGPVLLAVNPFREIPGLYSEAMIEHYRSGASGNVTEAVMTGGGGSAHIFALAEETYRMMVGEEEDQCVIISGESGAGKTEASKQIMKYVSTVSGDTPAMAHVKRVMLESNPLMEAFGNAKTLRNDNSSRFGKFLQIYFDRRGGPVGGRMTIFLLEKARVAFHQRGERNFHIFYQLCAGLGLGADGIVRHCPATLNATTNTTTRKKRNAEHDDGQSSLSDKEGDTRSDEDETMERVDHAALRDKLRLGPASAFTYLSMGQSLTRPGVDDAAEWQQTWHAMRVVGISEAVIEHIVTTLALVLHLGEIRFSAAAEEAEQQGSANTSCRVVNADAANYCSALLGVEVAKLQRALTWRRLQVGQTEIVDVPLDLQQCYQARDAIAKALYDSLFNFIVFCVNTSLDSVASEGASSETRAAKNPPSSSTPAADASSPPPPPPPPPPLKLGVLDIYGFEIFDSNGFEQFCINYVNEKLQQIFIELTLCAEQEEYVREGIAWEPVQYFDNRVVVELIENTAPPVGLFAVMDDVCAAMAKEDESVVDGKMLDKLESAASGHVRRVKTLYDERHPEEAARRAEQWERQEREKDTVGSTKHIEEDTIQADFGAAHFVRTDRGFVVKHYAGDVQYNATGFTARNKDRLGTDVTRMLAESTNTFLIDLFTEHGDVLSLEEVEAARDAAEQTGEGKRTTRMTSAHSSSPQSQQQQQQQQRRRTTTAGSKIRAQAAELVQTLKRSNPHYVRTIKSNDKKQARFFDDARVRHQIKYLGLLENVRVRRAGFSYRQYFDKFLKRFRYVCPQTFPRPYKGSDVEACETLLRYVSAHHTRGPGAFPAGAWQAGVHKLFIRQPTHVEALEEARKEAFDAIAQRIQRAWRSYVNRRLFVQLKSRMNGLYRVHGKARRADSVFRPYQGTYDCRWWSAGWDEGGVDDDGGGGARAQLSGSNTSAPAASRARAVVLERLLRPLIEWDPVMRAWRQVWTTPPAAATTTTTTTTKGAGFRQGKTFFANDLTGQVQWDAPRGWHQGLDTVLFMSPVRRLVQHDTAGTAEELLVLTERALFLFQEVLHVTPEMVRRSAEEKARRRATESASSRPARGGGGGGDGGAMEDTAGLTRLHPQQLPPPRTYELRTRVDLRLLAGLSLSHCADEVLLVHVFPLPAPYRPPLFHRADQEPTLSTAAARGGADTTHTTTDDQHKSLPSASRAGPPRRGGGPRYPVCDGCGGRLSSSLFVISRGGDAHGGVPAPGRTPSPHTAHDDDTVRFVMTAEARRRHACPGCGRWCCTSRCLVHRRPLPTLTGTRRPVKVCPYCRVGEPLEPLQDLVLLTPLKTELTALLCRTYQHIMSTPLPLCIGSPLPTSSDTPASVSKSVLLYQLAEDKGGPRGLLVMPRTEASLAVRGLPASWRRTMPTVMEAIATDSGERGQVCLETPDGAFWASASASTLLPPTVPYKEALLALSRAATTTDTTPSVNHGQTNHASRQPTQAPTETNAAPPQPVSWITVLAPAGIANEMVRKVEASREARRQAAAAQRREEEEAMRRREAEREEERALAHQRLVQERKQARAAAELRQEEEKLQQEAEAQVRYAKKERLLKQKQKELR